MTATGQFRPRTISNRIRGETAHSRACALRALSRARLRNGGGLTGLQQVLHPLPNLLLAHRSGTASRQKDEEDRHAESHHSENQHDALAETEVDHQIMTTLSHEGGDHQVRTFGDPSVLTIADVGTDVTFDIRLTGSVSLLPWAS